MTNKCTINWQIITLLFCFSCIVCFFLFIPMLKYFGFSFLVLYIYIKFNVYHSEVFNTYINIQWCISQKQQNFISIINQLDAQNVCFTISLFHASTCFEHMCSSSGGIWYHHTYRCDDTRGCVMQFWPPDDEHIVLETCRGMK